MVGAQANYNPPDRRPGAAAGEGQGCGAAWSGAGAAARNCFGVRLPNVGDIMQPVWRAASVAGFGHAAAVFASGPKPRV